MTAAPALLVETITSDEGLYTLESQWRSLERTSENTLPFRTFIWTSCWWRHLREARLGVRDSLAIRAVRAGGDRLVGVAPFIVTERPGVGPFRARCLQLIGADPNVTEIAGLLCEPGLEAACHDAIRDDLVRCLGDLDWIRWTGIEEHSGMREAFERRCVSWRDGVSCYVLDLPESWDALRASRPPNLREALRKGYRSLMREGKAFELEIVTDEARAAPAVRDFFRLHAARAKVTGVVAHPDIFRDAPCRDFLLDVCGRFAQRGALRIFRLNVDGHLAATRIGFVVGSGLYLYYSGLDPDYAKYRVGTTLVAEAIKHAISERLSSVNLSTGSDPSKSRWRPREIAFREAVFVSPAPLGRAKYRAFDAAKRAMAGSPVARYAERLLARRVKNPEAA